MYHGTLTTLVLALATNIAAQQGTASVDLSKHHGPAKALGSGFIYGWPDNGTQIDTSIPDYLVAGIKFNANRGGGAQFPSLGWARGGYEGYHGRFNSTLSNYRTTRKYNAEFILLPHDLWGADGGQGSNSPFPGDNGNWTEMELFWNQLISDLKAHNMLEGLVIDVWNEPDIDIFWDRSWPQFLEYYNRATRLLRKALPGTLLSGPAMAHSPILSDDKWYTWLQSVAGNKTVPDTFSWHQIGDWEREPDSTIPDFTTLRGQYGVPEKSIDINYVTTSEVWRANWGGGSDLHNWMGNLIYSTTGTSEGTYYPNGEWQVYKYYAAMAGQRLLTKASPDLKFDVFATKQGHKIKILVGTRTVQAKYDVKISGLRAVELPKKGAVKVRTYRFDWAGPNGKVDRPIDLGEKRYTYSANTLTLSVNPPTNATAFAYEFSI
ncbi:hypothetical protein FPCIR_13352 [Fusarium pseudocircinatum]|uniref:Glycoside hydrolase family 39 protein n=1 Tax=Fusarium pseudocircinatum TaxID=56676 RepID=A0A8H5KNA4_9HYPO|nr:hypothetical protein FPCIR_13352 [Fusarium pseudocircinatum]